MLRTIISKISAFLAMIFIIQPGIMVYASVEASTKETVEIMRVQSADPFTLVDGQINISQVAEYVSPNQLSVEITLQALENEDELPFVMNQQVSSLLSVDTSTYKIIDSEGQLIEVENVETDILSEPFDTDWKIVMTESNEMKMSGKLVGSKAIKITYQVSVSSNQTVGEEHIFIKSEMQYKYKDEVREIDFIELNPVVELGEGVGENKDVNTDVTIADNGKDSAIVTEEKENMISESVESSEITPAPKVRTARSVSNTVMSDVNTTTTTNANGDNTYTVQYNLSGNQANVQVPIDIAILIDRTSSMGQQGYGSNSYIKTAIDQLNSMLSDMTAYSQSIRYKVYNIGGSSASACTGGIGAKSGFGVGKSAATYINHMTTQSCNGNDVTNLTSALTTVYNDLEGPSTSFYAKRADAQQVILMLTDGVSNQNTTGLNTAINNLKAIKTTVNGQSTALQWYTVGMRPLTATTNEAAIRSALFQMNTAFTTQGDYERKSLVTGGTVELANAQTSQILKRVQMYIANNVAQKAKLNMTLSSDFQYVSIQDEMNAQINYSEIPHVYGVTWGMKVTPKANLKPGTYRVDQGQTTITYQDVDGVSKIINIPPLYMTITAPPKTDLKIDKTATKIEENYQLNLSVNGSESSQKADIVVILDRSGSMSGEKMTALKSAANNFVDVMLGGNDLDVQMSLVTFANSATADQYWTADATKVKEHIDNTIASGGTNTEASYIEALNYLKTARKDAQKYVVMFTDGLPTFYIDSNGAIGGNGSATTTTEVTNTKEAYNSILTTYPQTQMYSIGLFSGATDNTAQQLLFDMQNQETNRTTYVSKYYTSNSQSLQPIFTAIANIIKTRISVYATNTLISDTVASNFVLVPNSSVYYVNHLGEKIQLKQVVTTPKVGEVQLIKDTCNGLILTETNPAICDKIIANVGDLEVGGGVLTLEIQLRDESFFGEDIPTNSQATIEYTDIKNQNKVQEYPIPVVDIERIEDQAESLFNKVAKKLENNTYEIELSVSGMVDTLKHQNSKIVLAFDTSEGNTRLAEQKQLALTFIEKILKEDSDNRHSIQIIAFNEVSNSVSTGFMRDIQSLTQVLNNMKNSTNKMRNFSGAYQLANYQLITSTKQDPTALRSLILFSGGVATESQEIVKNSYNAIFAQNSMSVTSVYTLGLLPSSTTESDRKAAINLFSILQNSVPPSDYEKTFYPLESDLIKNKSLEKALIKVSEMIYRKVYDVVAYEARIEDIVTEQFRIIENSWRVNGLSEKQDIIYTSGKEDHIQAELGFVPEYDGNGNKNIVTLKFLIEPRNEYYGTNTPIDTNISASYNYIDPVSNKEVVKTKESPKVTVDYQMGSITVEKQTDVATEKTFDIQILGASDNNQQQFNFSVQKNKAKTMHFYLRDSKTDITPNVDFSKPYVTIGEFMVKEIIPQNYQQQSIEYCYDSDQINKDCQGVWKTYTNHSKIMIDKEHAHIFIRVWNKKTNDSRWYDDTNVTNILKYNRVYEHTTTYALSKQEDEYVA
ncbi:MAG: VWA domain-containing protein [Culicoidibacterales bacterium]